MHDINSTSSSFPHCSWCRGFGASCISVVLQGSIALQLIASYGIKCVAVKIEMLLVFSRTIYQQFGLNVSRALHLSLASHTQKFLHLLSFIAGFHLMQKAMQMHSQLMKIKCISYSFLSSSYTEM